MSTVSDFYKDQKLDYAEITPEQKVAINECVKILREMRLNQAAYEILTRTGLEEVPEYNLEESEFATLMQENNIFFAVQGHVIEDGVRYPIAMFTEDIRKLDKALLEYKHKSKKRKLW